MKFFVRTSSLFRSSDLDFRISLEQKRQKFFIKVWRVISGRMKRETSKGGKKEERKIHVETETFAHKIK